MNFGMKTEVRRLMKRTELMVIICSSWYSLAVIAELAAAELALSASFHNASNTPTCLELTSHHRFRLTIEGREGKAAFVRILSYGLIF